MRSTLVGLSRPVYTLKGALEQVAEPFVVDGLISSTLTLFYGKPKSSKSALVQLLIASVLLGQDFLGRSISLIKPRVFVLMTDFGGKDEYAKRLLDCGVSPDLAGNQLLLMELGSLSVEALEEARRAFLPTENDLVVIDHLSDFEGDLNSMQEVSAIFRAIDRMRGGAPVVIVAHSSTATGANGGSSRKPLGSTAIEAKARWIVHVERARERVRLRARGNAGAEQRVSLTLGNHAADFAVESMETSADVAAEARYRDEQTAATRLVRARWYLDNCQGMSNKKAGELLAVQFGGRSSSWAVNLSPSKWMGKLVHALATNETAES